MNSHKQFWNRKTLMLITGASQGIGEFWSIEFSKKLAKDSVVILWARSQKGLENTKEKVLQANPNITVKTHSIDLSNAKGNDMVDYLKQLDLPQFDLNLLVNNAGSVGDVKKLTSQMTDEQEWQRYLALNVTSFATLTSAFVQRFSQSPGETCILNVTSLAAIAPIRSFGFYCVGKAARESYLKVLAEEHPNLNILNYSPGCIYTDMVATILTNSCDKNTKESFKSMHETNTFVTLQDTTAKVIKALEERNYTSGGRIDYYDT